LEKVAHAGESLLSLLRDGKLVLSEEVTSGLLAMVDVVRGMLGEIQATEHDGENEYPELREQLKQLQGVGAAKLAPPVAAGAGIPAAATTSAAESVALASPASSIRILDAGPVTPTPPGEETSSPANGSSHPPVAGKVVGSQEEVTAAPLTQEARAHDSGVETVRVGVNLLDKLMNLVGELVLARNQLLQFSNTAQDAGLHTVPSS
jgi:two-component system chemotaxis sensor kinase CheA